MYGVGTAGAGGTLAATGAAIGSGWLVFAGLIFLGAALFALSRRRKPGAAKP